ncbi:DUF3078 domain-containing protein [bacterium]|nr:DUF3078 domain-containing protein [bacterium]
MKGYISLLILLVFVLSPMSEEWKNTGSIGFSFTQTAVNKNWSGGEKSSITYIWTLNHETIRDTEKFNWANKLQLQFGRSEAPNPDDPNFQIITEAADKISFTSTAMYKFKKFFNPLFMITCDSQFTEIFDPSVITETVGVGVIWADKDKFQLSSKLGVALKQLIDAEDDGVSSADDPTTLEEFETFISETGIQCITELTKVFADKLTLKSELKYFNTFAFDRASIKWDTTININLWKYVGLSFNLQWLFDQQVAGITKIFPKDHRLMETISLSFSYSLF